MRVKHIRGLTPAMQSFKARKRMTMISSMRWCHTENGRVELMRPMADTLAWDLAKSPETHG